MGEDPRDNRRFVNIGNFAVAVAMGHKPGTLC